MAKQTTSKKPAALGESETLNGSNTLPALIEISPDRSVQLGDVVMAAFQLSGLTAEAWNALAEPDRDGLLNGAIDGFKAAAAKEAELKAAALAAGAGRSGVLEDGPVCRTEVRYRGRTYAPGKPLPNDIDAETVGELRGLGAI